MVQLDFIVLVIFAFLIFGIGLAFTRIGSKSSQAFFEAGGATPWWINGLSLFISYFLLVLLSFGALSHINQELLPIPYN